MLVTASTSSILTLVEYLAILFLVVLWFSLIFWTYTDAGRRINDRMLINCATAASVFPFIGTLVYVILRPPEYLDDVHERELDIRAAEARLQAANESLCPHCSQPVGKEFLRCPHCLRKLRESCRGCGKPLDDTWRICPYCETDVPGKTPPRKPRPAGAKPAQSGAKPVQAASRGAQPGRSGQQAGQPGKSAQGAQRPGGAKPVQGAKPGQPGQRPAQSAKPGQTAAQPASGQPGQPAVRRAVAQPGQPRPVSAQPAPVAAQPSGKSASPAPTQSAQSAQSAAAKRETGQPGKTG